MTTNTAEYSRQYYLRNKDRIRSQQKSYKSAGPGVDVNHRCAERWYQAAKSRGVVLHRQKLPRSLAAWARRLRWRITLRSTNGVDVGLSAWSLIELYGVAEIRFRERTMDREMCVGPAAKWLRENSQAAAAAIKKPGCA